MNVIKERKKMKINTLLKGTLLSGLLLGPLVSTTVNAEDVQTSNAQIEFTEPTDSPTILDPSDPTEDAPVQTPEEDDQVTGSTGPLTIDYVSNLNFGTHEVDVAEATYQAENALPYVQVSDRRGTAAGWNLTVQASNFTSAGTDTLPGSYLTLSNGDARSRLTGITAPVISNPIVVETAGAAVQVANAPAGSGMGSWLSVWEGTEGANDNVELTVPQAAASVGTHTSTLTWTLADAPGQ